MKIDVYNKRLSNGAKVVLARQQHNNVVALKIIIRVGSQNDGQHYGITHFLEHALFNNRERNREVFYQIECDGGLINANTARDYLSIYIVVTKNNLFQSLSKILNLILNYNATTECIEAEKKIILQEILSHQNSTGAMWDLFLMNYWKEHPLRYPIRGFANSIQNINSDLLQEHYNQYISPENMIISCAGNVIEEELISFLEEYFIKYNGRKETTSTDILVEKVVRDKIFVERDLLMTHLFMAFPIEGFKHSSRIYFKGISKLLGGGAYSRLYQLLREDKKLIYSIESNELLYGDTGIFLIYTKCNPEYINEVENLINVELANLRTQLISENELNFLKSNYVGSLERRFETMLSVCNSFGIEELLLNSTIPFEDAISNFNAITLENLRDTAKEFLINPKIILIGNKKN